MVSKVTTEVPPASLRSEQTFCFLQVHLLPGGKRIVFVSRHVEGKLQNWERHPAGEYKDSHPSHACCLNAIAHEDMLTSKSSSVR